MEEKVEDPKEVLSDLQDLVKSRGWVRLSNLAEAQKATRTANCLAPGGGDEKEFQKGEIAGIALFMKLPEMAMESLRQQIEEEDSAPDEDVVNPPAP